MNKLFLSIAASFLMTTSVFGVDEKLKTGFFGGIDLGTVSFYDSRPVFSYGLKGGYQFYGSLKHGMRLGTYLSMGSYGVDSNNSLESTNTSYFGLRYGIGVDYLYDFYDNANMTLGFSVGLGYELANHFVKYKKSTPSSSSGGGRPGSATTNTDINFKVFGGGSQLRLGAHAYFLNHQVELGVLSPFETGGYLSNGKEKVGLVDQKILINTFSSFYFSYTYRF